MMIISCSDLPQDTVSRKPVINNDTGRDNADSALNITSNHTADTVKHKIVAIRQNILPDYNDTTSVCIRNSVADVTFYDSSNVVFKIEAESYKQFPYLLIERARKQKIEEKALLVRHLKPGNELPENPLHADWMIIIIIAVAFLYSLVKTRSKSIFPDFIKFFLLRGTNDPLSHDGGGLFYWQATILNLASFIIMGLFSYLIASFYNIIPSGFKGIIAWLIALGIICLAVTLRHVVCITTGAASDEREVYRKYLIDVYQSYRFGAFFLFILIILMSYTSILPDQDLIISGILILGLMYLIRIIRLLIIFLKRNISIFYLILYLCALEILPVLIVVKYFTGLV
jgi:hypothetical protein